MQNKRYFALACFSNGGGVSIIGVLDPFDNKA